MGHHIDAEGRFQSDKYPELAPDKIIISFKDKRAHKALVLFAADCMETDPELAADIMARVRALRNLP
jgi:hypothetical protein